jgi:hypothetical protein
MYFWLIVGLLLVAAPLVIGYLYWRHHIKVGYAIIEILERDHRWTPGREIRKALKRDCIRTSYGTLYLVLGELNARNCVSRRTTRDEHGPIWEYQVKSPYAKTFWALAHKRPA